MFRKEWFWSLGALVLLQPAAAREMGSPVMTTEPPALFFSPRLVGTIDFTQTVQIHNAPGGSQLSYTVAIMGPAAADFPLFCDGGGLACLSGLVNSGSTAYIYVAFAPTAEGTRDASLFISGNDAGNPSDSITLFGVGEGVFGNGFETGNALPWSSCTGCPP